MHQVLVGLGQMDGQACCTCPFRLPDNQERISRHHAVRHELMDAKRAIFFSGLAGPNAKKSQATAPTDRDLACGLDVGPRESRGSAARVQTLLARQVFQSLLDGPVNDVAHEIAIR